MAIWSSPTGMTSTTTRTTKKRKTTRKKTTTMTTSTTTSTATMMKRRKSTSDHGGSVAAEKDERLRELLSEFSSAIVAFSGGVDSAYLSVVATQVLGPGALCVTADSPSYPEHHRSLARQVADAFALRHEVVATG